MTNNLCYYRDKRTMSGLQEKYHSHDNHTPVIPSRNPCEEIRLGMEFNGVIDGIIPGGYLLTIRKGNVLLCACSPLINLH